MVHSPLDFRFAVNVACAFRSRLQQRHFIRNWSKSHRLHPRRSSCRVCWPDDLSNTGHAPVPRRFETGAAKRQWRGISPAPPKFNPIKHYCCTNQFSNCPSRALGRWEREQRHMPFECRRDCRECAWGVQRAGNSARPLSGFGNREDIRKTLRQSIPAGVARRHAWVSFERGIRSEFRDVRQIAQKSANATEGSSGERSGRSALQPCPGSAAWDGRSGRIVSRVRCVRLAAFGIGASPMSRWPLSPEEAARPSSRRANRCVRDDLRPRTRSGAGRGVSGRVNFSNRFDTGICATLRRTESETVPVLSEF